MSYLAIAQQCVDASRGRGFVATVWADVPVRLKGIDSEICELRSEIVKGNIRGMSLESADVAALSLIVLLDLGHVNWKLRSRIHRGPPVFASPSDLVEPLREYSSKAYEAWRMDRRPDVLICLEILLAHLVDLRTRCLRLPNDLHFDLQCKLAINTGRAACNGGKNPRS